MAFPSRVFSGIQPTGIPHLGNYLGALRQWVELQETHECLFGIMDLHAITVPKDPARLRQDIREIAASLIAIGIDPARSILFQQSVAPHAELGWILGCMTPLGWLNRMTQFKEKAGKQKENASLGLYGYPVLQAADILLYRATLVPVGEDQKQHLELSRDIAGAFNRAVGEAFFPLPEPLILAEGARIMSLRDGTSKMSKSDPSDFSRIGLTDSDDVIVQKIRKAKSDSHETIGENLAERPEAANLIGMLGVLLGRTKADILAEYGDRNFSAFKTVLTDALIAILSPIRERALGYMADPAMLDAALATGAGKALELATPVMQAVRCKVGLTGGGGAR